MFPRHTLLLLLSLLLSLLVAQVQADQDFSGLWVGTYKYAEDSPDPVLISVVFEHEGSEIKGRSLEVQTFGREPAIGLSASLIGYNVPGDLFLVKKYDGSGGQTHAVDLELNYVAEDNTLSGTWQLGDDSHGVITLVRMSNYLFEPE